jgi:hypothetical protein
MLIKFSFLRRTADGDVPAQTQDRGSESAHQQQLLVKQSEKMPRNSTKDDEQEDDKEEEEIIESPQNLSKKRGILAPVARPAQGRIRRRKIRPRQKPVVAAGSQKPVQQEQQVGLKLNNLPEFPKYCLQKYTVPYLEKNWMELGKNFVSFRTVGEYVWRR